MNRLPIFIAKKNVELGSIELPSGQSTTELSTCVVVNLSFRATGRLDDPPEL